MNSRRFPDALGCVWETWSVRPDGHAEAEPLAHVPLPLRDGWLVFAHGMERRRLYPIPEGWSRAADADLRRLLDAAESVRAYAAISFPL
jgi:hypothetical protein